MRFLSHRACATPASVLALLLAFSLAAQQQPALSQQTPTQPAAYHLDDPANLAGERVSPQDPADTLPLNHGAPALQQLLQKLRTRASFMLIVAHPDDEDGGLLTYLSRGQGARVAMLTLNRGEGGQNLMSADFDDALGLIRTQELLAADRYLGVDQFFGSVVDFGFSKTKEEALAKWGHDRVLYDAVRAIRLYRPLVIASVFVGGPTDGHGQHQVAGEIAQEVFTAAADPKVFPEMGLPPWAPLKVYARAPFARIDTQGMFDYATGKYSPPRFVNYVTGAVSATPPSAAVVIHEGDPAIYTNPDGSKTPIPGMNGLSYVQFARQGLALQKSQNGGASRGGGGGPVDTAYARYGSRIANSPPSEQSLFDGIDTSLAGIASLAPEAKPELRAALEAIDKQIAEAQRLFSPDHPELTAPPLREALRTLDTLIATVGKSPLDSVDQWNLLHELRIKRVQANNALVLAHGLALEPFLGKTGLAAESTLLSSDTQISITVKASDRSNEMISFQGITLKPLGTTLVAVDRSGVLSAESSTTYVLDSPIKESLPPTRPYFTRKSIEQPFYDISDQALRNAAQTPPPLTVELEFQDHGIELTAEATVQYAGGPQKGQPVAVVPPISLAVSPSAGILTPGFLGADLDVAVLANTRQATGKLSVDGPPDWKTLDATPFSIANAEEEYRERLSATPKEYSPKPLASLPKAIPPGTVYTFNAVAAVGGRQFREGYRSVGYKGLTYTNYYTPATYRATAVDLHTAPDVRVAYVAGTGDDVPAYLPDLGVTPTILTLADLTSSKLAQYDAVVLGVRAYAAHPELAGPGSQPLLDYARQGGVVIVQYNTARYGDADAPYPIAVPGSADMNVVEEADPVTLLVPDSPILTWPNRITSADFDHWVEERGHGFARTWAPEYQPLLEMHDPGQDEEKGGLLVAHTGKGYYIYTALALYRQLPEGVPGAYRLFANLLSIAKNPALHTPTTPPAK